MCLWVAVVKTARGITLEIVKRVPLNTVLLGDVLVFLGGLLLLLFFIETLARGLWRRRAFGSPS